MHRFLIMLVSSANCETPTSVVTSTASSWKRALVDRIFRLELLFDSYFNTRPHPINFNVWRAKEKESSLSTWSQVGCMHRFRFSPTGSSSSPHPNPNPISHHQQVVALESHISLCFPSRLAALPWCWKEGMLSSPPLSSIVLADLQALLKTLMPQALTTWHLVFLRNENLLQDKNHVDHVDQNHAFTDWLTLVVTGTPAKSGKLEKKQHNQQQDTESFSSWNSRKEDGKLWCNWIRTNKK